MAVIGVAQEARNFAPRRRIGPALDEACRERLQLSLARAQFIIHDPHLAREAAVMLLQAHDVAREARSAASAKCKA